METISNTLFWISNGLLVPVVVLLLLFFLRALIMIGGFFGEFYQRTKLQQQFNTVLEAADDGNIDNRLEQFTHNNSNLPLAICINKIYAHRNDTAYCERLLANYEVDAEKELGKSKTFAKLGPMLGLMGTLIPMGPALVGLAEGDISSMAYNMQVAFATTVVGMVIAAIGIITLQTRQRWYARELNDLEYLYKIILKQSDCHEKK